MTPIESLADCIMQFEGWRQLSQAGFPNGSTSWRNRNPGNLRPYNITQPRDERGYRIFPSLSLGWSALIDDLTLKLDGQSSHKLTSQNTLHDLFNIYAPALDSNDPQQYSRMVALWMTKIFKKEVTPDTKLEDILKLA